MEGDSRSSCICQSGFYFYPRPHMEGDSEMGRVDIVALISTHALTWRATLGSIDSTEVNLSKFLPTPSHGGRPARIGGVWQAWNFYPRPHMEGDGSVCRIPIRYYNFYPRPHMEGDSSGSTSQ